MNPISLQIGKNGRMVIPISLRQALQLDEGDTLVATVEGNRLILETEAALLDRLYETVGPNEGELVSEELIGERREEIEREQGEVEA